MDPKQFLKILLRMIGLQETPGVVVVDLAVTEDLTEVEVVVEAEAVEESHKIEAEFE